ncbi:MAG: spore coat associated protein CotJA [Clostridia bacterium]|nr:spore coat associated protein CotJA [Clostridia bacterium]
MPGTGCACAGTMRGSLAMVYSPRQYWRDAYSPAEALDRGTLFMELDKPLTGVCTGGDAS